MFTEFSSATGETPLPPLLELAAPPLGLAAPPLLGLAVPPLGLGLAAPPLLRLAVPPLRLAAPPLLGLEVPLLGLGNVTGAAVCVGLKEEDSPPELLGLAELLEVLLLPLEEPKLGLEAGEEGDAAPAEEEEDGDGEEEEDEEVMG